MSVIQQQKNNTDKVKSLGFRDQTTSCDVVQPSCKIDI